jgi:transcriptional regulator with XRE-family HTH domain
MVDLEKTPSSGSPNAVDVYVGRRLRIRRTLMGMSQSDLSNALGLPFQQIQKYEQGLNRIGSSRLYDISRLLSVSISYFFEDLVESGDTNDQLLAGPLLRNDPTARRETLELVRAFARIENKEVRESIMEMINLVIDEQETTDG